MGHSPTWYIPSNSDPELTHSEYLHSDCLNMDQSFPDFASPNNSTPDWSHHNHTYPTHIYHDHSHPSYFHPNGDIHFQMHFLFTTQPENSITSSCDFKNSSPIWIIEHSLTEEICFVWNSMMNWLNHYTSKIIESFLHHE